jgi:hypothetical protein
LKNLGQYRLIWIFILQIFGERYNDGLILDCCKYFSRGRNTVLCSADNNLCLESEAAGERKMFSFQGLCGNSTPGVNTVIPGYRWSSRDLARCLYGDVYGLDQFEGYKESYRNPLTDDFLPCRGHHDDIMMIDDSQDDWTPQHPLNLLHEAVIDHFTRLLVELVGRVGGAEVRQETSTEEEANLSRHAPRKLHYCKWTASDCLQYLNRRKGIRPRNPPAERFLLKVNPKSTVPYARRGWEWTRRDWEIALNNLMETAVAWEDISIPESLQHVHPHMEAAFR